MLNCFEQNGILADKQLLVTEKYGIKIS